MSPVILIFIAIGTFLLLAAGLIVIGLRGALAGGSEMQERMQAYAAIPDLAPRREQGRRGQFARLRLRLNMMLSSLASESLNLQLLSANWPITVTEFMLIRFGATLLAFLVGWFFARSPIAGLALAVIGYLVPVIYLKRSISQRQIKFERQLIDVLVLINGAVRAGFSLLQAIEVVVKEMKAPASEEFQRVVREVGLGRPLGQALSNMAVRMQNQDLNLVVTAINIHYQVGGNLSTMLQAVTATIRDRIRLFSEVRVLTTQQRYTSYLISLLPFFVGGMLFFMNPDYMSRLFQRDMLCVPVGAVIGILVGHLVIQRITKIDV